MPSTTMTIDQLALSPHNVRTNREDQLNTAGIERSLLTTGQMFPLLVHPMKGRRDQWGVFAGGRRWRSFKNLIERGELPRDHAIEVVVRDLKDAELTELSLAENLLRRDLRPYEEHAAVLKAQARGATPEQIAQAIGQELRWVKGALRLATLAPALIAALETGRLSVEQAQAFGATEDNAAQLAAWDRLRGTGDMVAAGTTPAQIRAALKVGDPELQRLLLFVGDDAYRAGGGRFELDLFAGQAEQRGRVTDEPVLRRLVDEKLGEMRTALRARVGRDVRFQAKPPQTGYGQPDHQLQVSALEIPLEGQSPAEWRIELPAGDVVGTIAISGKGEAEVSWWWSSSGAKNASRRKPASDATKPPRAAARRDEPPGSFRIGVAINDAASPGAQREADAAIKADTGLGQDNIQIMRSLRRAIFRAALVDVAREHQTWAVDYLVWAQLRMVLGDEHEAQVGMRAIGQDRSAASLLGQEHIRATIAHRRWQDAIEDVRRTPAIKEADQATAFAWYSAQNPRWKNVAGAIVAGLAMERTLAADGYDLPAPALIAANIGLDDEAVRRLWTPTAELLALIPRADQLAIAEPFLERVTFGAWQRLKAGELTAKLFELVTGAGAGAKASMARAAAQWVHPLLRFRRSEPVLVDAVDEARELEVAE